MLRKLEILKNGLPNNKNVRSVLYLTNKIYITNHERINDEPIHAILLFWPYCFTYLSSLIVALFIEIILSNAKFGDMVVRVCLMTNSKSNLFSILGSAMQALLLWVRNKGAEKVF